MSIKYDEEGYVKRPELEIDYSVEMLKELEKCSKDFYHFLKYVKIVHPDKGRVEFVPRDYQKKILDSLLENKYVIACTARQVGKCFYKNVKIKLRNKRTGKIEEIEVGDFFNKIKNK